MQITLLPMTMGSPLKPRDFAVAGFTTVELLAVVAITCVVAAVAAPSFSSLFERQKVKSVGSELFFSLLRARSEAVARNASVTLAPAVGSNWQQGWQILDPASATTVLDSHGSSNGTTIAGPSSVVYDGGGRIKGGIAPTFVIAAIGGATATYQCVSVDLSGRPYQKAAPTC
jgi:type IV fimbrial biogenesis protein FimT